MEKMFAPEPEWGADPGVRARFTTRSGGASAAPFDSLNLSERVSDDAESVAENRRRVCEFLPSRPKWLRQVHGTKMVWADRVGSDSNRVGPDSGRVGPDSNRVGSDADLEADGAFTFSRGVVCAVTAADCLPVFLCAKGSGVAVAHAGWRGLAGGILENAYAILRRESSAEIVARIGPGISAECYPVGDEVRTALRRDDADDDCFTPAGGGKWKADLKGLAARRLLALGASRVLRDSECTFSCPSRYFSARRDGPTGRMAALIWRE